jgi:4-amino-4-deoxy-L-arabinose transferase-like glycosyltransferase
VHQGLNWPWLVLVLAIFGIPLFIGLGATDLANDEAIYSYAAESILTTGDWLSPRSSPNEEITFVEKPPLKFWIVAAPIKLGLLPYNEFGLRFWDAVFGAVAFVYVFLIGHRLAGPICGLFAVLVLFAHGPLLFDHGLRSNNMDAALVLTYAGGVYHFLRWGDPGARRGTHITAVAGWFFLGFMTKFVAALFLPAVLFLSALLLPSMRRLLAQDWWRWGIAAAGVVVLALPWFLYQWSVLGSQLWRVMFGDHVYTRFTQFADPQHVQPWHFYISEAYKHLTFAGSAIWVGLGVVMLLVHCVRRRTPESVVILLWLVLPVTLISLGSSKLYHYFYPFLPPLALAAGAGVAWIIAAAGRYSLPDNWTPNLSPALRAVAWGVAALAITLAVSTAILSTVRIDALMFRNSSIVRPVVVALLALTAAGSVRLGSGLLAAVLMALLLPTPVTAYGHNLRRVNVTKRPLGAVADCVRHVNPDRAGAYAPVSEAAFLHPYYYYFRGDGWHFPADQERLMTALKVEGQQRPVVLDHALYARLVDKNDSHGDPPATIELPTVLVLLPGPFRTCGTAAGSSVR